MKSLRAPYLRNLELKFGAEIVERRVWETVCRFPEVVEGWTVEVDVTEGVLAEFDGNRKNEMAQNFRRINFKID